MEILKKHSDAHQSLDLLSRGVVDCVFQVHKNVGAGYLERIYEECLCLELEERGIAFERQCPINFTYKGKSIPSDFRLDMVIDGAILVELKAVERMHPVYEAQVLSYLKMSGLPLGFLVNFNVPLIKDGIKRFAAQNLRDFVPSWQKNKEET